MTICEIGQLGSDQEGKNHIPTTPLRDRTTPSPSEISLALDMDHAPGMTYHKEVVILLLAAGTILWRHRTTLLHTEMENSLSWFESCQKAQQIVLPSFVSPLT